MKKIITEFRVNSKEYKSKVKSRSFKIRMLSLLLLIKNTALSIVENHSREQII